MVSTKAMHAATAGRHPESGMALMLALLFIVLLTAIIVEYAYENRVEASFVENSIHDFQAEVAAKSAVATGLSLLAADMSIEQMMYSQGLSGLGNALQQVQAQAGGSQGLGQQIDSLQDAWALGVPYRAMNDAAMQCLIADEYGKLNVNALVPPEQYSLAYGDNGAGLDSGAPAAQNPGTAQRDADANVAVVPEPDEMLQEVFRILFELRGAQDDPTDAIMDWIDPDDDTRPNGAESDFYATLDIPYACKNAPMDSLEELLLVRGITPEVFFGNPDEGQLLLSELLTIHGHPRGRINLNTAPYELLMAIGEAMGQQADLADRVYEERDVSPITSDEDATSRGLLIPVQDKDQNNQGGGGGKDPKPPQPPGEDQEQNTEAQQTFAEKPYVYASNSFRIRGSGESGDVAVMIEVFVWRSDATTFASALQEYGVQDNARGRPGLLAGNNRELTQSQRNLGGTNFSGPDVGPQLFRILDWRVMR